MSRSVFKKLSWICLLIAVVVGFSGFLNPPHGSLLWYLQDFTSLFLIGCLLLSSPSLAQIQIGQPRLKKFLFGIAILALVATLVSTTAKVFAEQEKQAQKRNGDKLKRDTWQLERDTKQIATDRPA